MRSLPNDGLRPGYGMYGCGGVEICRVGRWRPGTRRQADRQARAPARRRVDVNRALQVRDTLADADQPEAAARLRRLEADAVGFDGDEHHGVLPTQVNDR